MAFESWKNRPCPRSAPVQFAAQDAGLTHRRSSQAKRAFIAKRRPENNPEISSDILILNWPNFSGRI